MPDHSVTRYSWNEVPSEEVTPLLSRRLVTGDQLMLAQVDLKKGCPVPRHQHEHEQVSYIIGGALRFWIGEDEKEELVLKAGDVLHIPSNVWHKAEALEDARVMDVFTPPRLDWLNKTDAYLRKK